jgi:nucleoside 2-deoxyribosyltransferase
MIENKIYLAGPDVFRRDAVEHFDKLKDLCAKYGQIALSPFDNEVDVILPGAAMKIFKGNVDMINECDVVFAHLDPFRGPNVDDGTAFEIGMAYALGRPIYGYSDCHFHNLKTTVSLLCMDKKRYPHVEDFDHPCNLMIAECITESGGRIFETIEECLYAYVQKITW